MTREEAIKMLQTEKACVERQERKQNCNRYCESCDLCMPIEDVIEGYNVAIRALKNEQTDGDMISRQAVKDLIRGLTRWGVRSQDGKFNNVGLLYDDVMFGIDRLPSAEKTTLSEEKTTINGDLISRQAALYSITAEYNRRLPADGLKLAYIEKALNEVEGVTK